MLDEGKDIINTAKGRDIDWVELDAVSIVTKGAYPQEDITVAQKIFKQYDNFMKDNFLNSKIEKVSLRDKVKESNSTSDFLVETAKLDEALKLLLEDIASDGTLSPEAKEKECKRVLSEYANETLSNYKSINFNLGDEEMPKKAKTEEIQPQEEVKEEVSATPEEETTKQMFNKEEFMKELENVMSKFTDKAAQPEGEETVETQKDAPDMIAVLQDVMSFIQQYISQLGGAEGEVEESATAKEDDGKNVNSIIEPSEANAKTPDNIPSTNAKPGADVEPTQDLDEIISELEKKSGRKLSLSAKQELGLLKKKATLPKEVRQELEDLRNENVSLRKSMTELENKVNGLVDGLNEFSKEDSKPVAIAKETPKNTSLDIDVLEKIVKAFKQGDKQQTTKQTFNPREMFTNTLRGLK